MRKWRWEQANKQKVYFEPVLYTAKIIPIHILLCLNMSIYVIKVKWPIFKYDILKSRKN